VAVVLYYGSGSPYAWRAWLALEHKGVPHELKTMSFAAGDLKTPEYSALNPRRRVPVLVDDSFVLYESAAIVEYIEERWPAGPPLFAADLCEQRRIASRQPGFPVAGLVGPRLSAWLDRMRALPLVRRTWPPHWS
jgi:glutathione S-transferase